MQGCISISKFYLVFAALALLLAQPGVAHAAGKGASDDDEFSTTPFTEYGEFNQEEEEEADTRFMQYGRLFGVSVGVGNEGTMGNRGKLWNGGFPLLEINVHYWFNFNLALELGFSTVKHNYSTTVDSLWNVDVSMTHIGANLKYYFDTKNLSAPISFANPYILGGIGSFSKTETSDHTGDSNSDSAFALDAGVGLEFALVPRKSYFAVEGKIFTATFADTNTDHFTGQGIDDLSGPFFTVVGSFLFVW